MTATQTGQILSKLFATTLACAVAIGCGDDDDSGGSNSTGDSATLVAAITSTQYDALCRRFVAVSDLSVLDECTTSATTAECNECTDGLLGGSSDDCAIRIGEVGSYPESCAWTLGMLNDCFDEQEQILHSLSCDKPGREMLGDDDNCLYQFRKKCVPESI